MTRAIVRTLALWGALLLAVLAAACAPAPATTAAPQPAAASPTPLPLPTALPLQPTSPPAPTVAAAGGEVTGDSLYQVSCSACHGADRGGNEFEIDGQKISVPGLTWDDLSKMYSTDPSRGDVAQQLALAITKGESEDGEELEPMMPRWSALSQAQVDSLVQYLQNPGTASAALSPEAASLTGEALYRAACASCHGADGAGKTFESDGNKVTTPSLSWADLSKMYTADPSRGDPAIQVGLAISKGQDEEAGDLEPMMPRWSFLSQAQVESLVQYLQTAFP